MSEKTLGELVAEEWFRETLGPDPYGVDSGTAKRDLAALVDRLSSSRRDGDISRYVRIVATGKVSCPECGNVLDFAAKTEPCDGPDVELEPVSRDGAGVEETAKEIRDYLGRRWPWDSLDDRESREQEELRHIGAILTRFASSLESARARAEAERDGRLHQLERAVEINRELRQDRDAARAEAARLREALEPFAACAEFFTGEAAHLESVSIGVDYGTRRSYSLKPSDFMRAAALSGPGAKTGDDDA